ncbi:MAG: hypothetical protein EOO29_51130 [Comamonadaceae bacterium]|nr:MAG: hypothetical protein EOO29_51130 [Comamonadaceae bacterium]
MKTAAAGLRPEQGQKPSMLQDAIARRPLEVEPIMGQLCAFADETGVAVPALQTLLALLRGLDARGAMGL